MIIRIEKKVIRIEKKVIRIEKKVIRIEKKVTQNCTTVRNYTDIVIQHTKFERSWSARNRKYYYIIMGLHDFIHGESKILNIVPSFSSKSESLKKILL